MYFLRLLLNPWEKKERSILRPDKPRHHLGKKYHFRRTDFILEVTGNRWMKGAQDRLSLAFCERGLFPTVEFYRLIIMVKTISYLPSLKILLCFTTMKFRKVYSRLLKGCVLLIQSKSRIKYGIWCTLVRHESICLSLQCFVKLTMMPSFSNSLIE